MDTFIEKFKDAGWILEEKKEDSFNVKYECKKLKSKWNVTCTKENGGWFTTIIITTDALEGSQDLHPEAKDDNEFEKLIVAITGIQDLVHLQTYDTVLRVILNNFRCSYIDGWLKEGVSKKDMTKEQLQARKDFIKATQDLGWEDPDKYNAMFDGPMAEFTTFTPEAKLSRTFEKGFATLDYHAKVNFTEMAMHDGQKAVYRIRCFSPRDWKKVLEIITKIAQDISPEKDSSSFVDELFKLKKFSKTVAIETEEGWKTIEKKK